MDFGPFCSTSLRIVAVGIEAIRSRSSMLKKSAETEKPLMDLGDQTTPADQLRDWEGSSFELEPVCERHWRLPLETPSELRMAYKILKDAGYVPAEIEMMQKLASLREQLDATKGEAAQRELKTRIAEMQQKVTLMLEAMLEAYDEDEAPNAKGGVDKRTVLRLDPRLAPVKAAVLPLSRNADLSPKARDLAAELRKYWNIEFDDAGAIGRRYRRQDEIGTPFCVTVDFDTLEDNAVTIRERDAMTQERVGLDNVVGYLAARLPGV